MRAIVCACGVLLFALSQVPRVWKGDVLLFPCEFVWGYAVVCALLGACVVPQPVVFVVAAVLA